MGMKISGNIFQGKIQKIEEGAANATVTIVTGNGHAIQALIMMTSLKNLALKVGMEAYAIFKGASVLIAPIGTKMSGNKFEGKVSNIEEGAANANVIIDIGGGQTISSIIMTTSLKSLELAVGMEVYAVVKGSSVFIAVED